MNRFTEKEVEFLIDLKSETIGVCDKCIEGWIQDKPCTCREVFIYLKELVFSRIPQDYWHLKLKDLDIEPESAIILVENYLENFNTASKKGKGICFLGSNGIGKTSLLVEIGKQAVLRGFDTIYVTAQDYIEYKMTNDYENLSRIEEEAKIVLLDELDKPYQKKGSEYVTSKMEALFRNLLPRNVVVCIGSNWTKDEIKNYYGDSTYSIMLRKIKFLTILGDDFSDGLQERWEEDISGESVNYLNNYFVKLSGKMCQQ